MTGRHDPVLAGVAGFLLGGVVVDTFTEVASVIIAGGTLGGMAGAIYGAMRQDADAEHAAVLEALWVSCSPAWRF